MFFSVIRFLGIFVTLLGFTSLYEYGFKTTVNLQGVNIPLWVISIVLIIIGLSIFGVAYRLKNKLSKPKP